MGSDAFHHGHIARRALRDRVVILVGDIRFGDQDAADAGAGHSGVQVIAEVLRRNTADRQKRDVVDGGTDGLDILQVDAVRREELDEVRSGLISQTA